MRESWLDETVGDEASPRKGFEDQLARQLQQEWNRGRTGWRIAIWATAAAVVIAALVVVVANRGDDDVLVPSDSSNATTPVTTVTPTPTTATAPTTTVPDSTSTSIVSTTLPAPTDAEGYSVWSYLTALSEGRWTDAAKFLNEGGLEPEARADMRPLFRPEFGLVPGATNNDAVATALQRWCDVSLCSPPASVVTVDNHQIVTWISGGVARSATFAGFTFEGQPGVQGLPLELPDGADLADTVACRTDHVARQTWADLDGDGWLELVVISSPSETDAVNVISVCGSKLEVSPLQLTDGEGIWAYAVNPAGTGADMLLMGSVPPFPAGLVYQVDGDHFATMAGPDGDATFAFITPFAPEPGHSTGCATLNGEPTLVNNSYEYVGGTELSNSTQLTYTQVNATGTNSAGSGGTFDLPADIDAAFEVVAGYCNGLPVMTGG